jgi:hypothetical protein
MTSTSTSCYPPIYTLQPPQSIPPSLALTYIQNYLTSTLTQPHLHPSSQLTERGPTASLSSNSAGGLVLHNLRRVEAGLRGERWGDLQGDEAEGERAEEGCPEEQEGWEDMERYRMEQGEVVGAGKEGGVGEVPIEVQESGKAVDKAERKRLKKERREKRKMEEKMEKGKMEKGKMEKGRKEKGKMEKGKMEKGKKEKRKKRKAAVAERGN